MSRPGSAVVVSCSVLVGEAVADDGHEVGSLPFGVAGCECRHHVVGAVRADGGEFHQRAAGDAVGDGAGGFLVRGEWSLSLGTVDGDPGLPSAAGAWRDHGGDVVVEDSLLGAVVTTVRQRRPAESGRRDPAEVDGFECEGGLRKSVSEGSHDISFRCRERVGLSFADESLVGALAGGLETPDGAPVGFVDGEVGPVVDTHERADAGGPGDAAGEPFGTLVGPASTQTPSGSARTSAGAR